MSKKVHLTQLEQFFPPELIEQGSRLFAEDRINGTEQATKNLWIVTINDDEHLLEVEVLLSGKKVKQFTCDCGGFQEEGICSHVVAALLMVRDKRTNNVREGKKKKEKEETPKRLTTNLVLQSISQDELAQFVRDYARQNRHFSLLLKTHFADKVNLLDNYEKYNELLKSIINLYRQQGKPLTQNSELQIAKLGNELIEIATANVEEKHYKEAISIISAILKRIGKLYRTAGKGQTSMGQLIIAALDIGKALLAERTLSPALKEEIWDSCVNVFDKPITLDYDLSKNFLELFFLLSEELNKAHDLMEILEINNNNRFRNKDTEGLFIAFQFILAAKYPNIFELKPLHAKVSDNFPVFEALINQLLLQQAWKTAEDILTTTIEQNQYPDQETALNIKKLEIETGKGNTKAIRKLAKKVFLLTLDFQYFDLYKKHSGDKWAKKKRKLLEAIPEDTLEFCQLKAEVLKRELHDDELIEFLDKCGSIDLLEAYTEYLIEQEKQKSKRLYPKILAHYLNTHVGRKAAERVRKLIVHLNRLGEKKLAMQLVEEIRQQFSERKSLMEELALFR